MMNEVGHLRKKIKKLKHRIFDEEEEEVEASLMLKASPEAPLMLKASQGQIPKGFSPETPKPEPELNLDDEEYIQPPDFQRPKYLRKADLLNYRKFGF
jgi:hypothetical protein